MIKVDRTEIPPPSLVVEKAKVNGSYREPDVVLQLQQDFRDKCYLCEIDELQSVEIEHLRPHMGDKDLKFDWNNLFLSCAHCNSVKNQRKYDNVIIDCCAVDPEEYLDQTFIEGEVKVTPLVQNNVAQMTAQLITECFEKRNTGIRVMESQVRINALKQTMNLLYRTLSAYEENPNEINLNTLRGLLERKHKFSAFTRSYVRTHLDSYPELQIELA